MATISFIFSLISMLISAACIVVLFLVKREFRNKIVNLKGPKGDKGEQGDKGNPGEDGKVYVQLPLDEYQDALKIEDKILDLPDVIIKAKDFYVIKED